MNVPHDSTLSQALPTTTHSLWGCRAHAGLTKVHIDTSRHVYTQTHTPAQVHTPTHNERYRAKKWEETVGGVTTVKIPVCPFASSQSCITLHHLQMCACVCVRICVCVRPLVCKALERANGPSSICLLTRCWMKIRLRRKE